MPHWQGLGSESDYDRGRNSGELRSMVRRPQELEQGDCASLACGTLLRHWHLQLVQLLSQGHTAGGGMSSLPFSRTVQNDMERNLD